MLELAITVLGGAPKRGMKIARPDMLLVCWLTNAIYAMKFYLFRAQSRLTTSKKKKSLQRIVNFVVTT